MLPMFWKRKVQGVRSRSHGEGSDNGGVRGNKEDSSPKDVDPSPVGEQLDFAEPLKEGFLAGGSWLYGDSGEEGEKGTKG